MKELESALVERGIPADIAHRHVTNIRRGFTAEDLSEIESIKSRDAVNNLADGIATTLKKKMNAVGQNQNNKASNAPVKKPPSKEVAPQAKRPVRPRPLDDDNFDDVPQKSRGSFNMNDDYFTDSSNMYESSKGSTVFWVGLIVTLPILLALLLLIFGTFAALFVGLVGTILAGVLLLIGIVGAGSVLSLVGIIFGVTQLFSFAPAGIYEIGLGIIIAGIVLFVSVLVYNLIIRFIPWLIKKVAKLLVFVCRKLKDLFNYIRRECYKL